MNSSVQVWRERGKYLPKILRDFHDQKELFKTMHRMVNVDKHEYCKEVTWIAGQCYVIDIFLWFMARHGYTLQRSRIPLEFDNLGAAIETCREEETKLLVGLLDTFAAAKTKHIREE